MDRQLNRSDRLIAHLDSALRSVVPNAVVAHRQNPAASAAETALDDLERRHVAGVVRGAHLAAVSAQGFSQGQAGMLVLPRAQRPVDQLRQETQDHLAWCHARLAQLHSRTSYFTPLYYTASLGMGLASGALSHRFGLGVLAASKTLLAQQLSDQQYQLHADDQRSRTLLRQMASDNAHHAQLAIEAGGVRFPAPVRWGMRVFTDGVLRSAFYT